MIRRVWILTVLLAGCAPLAVDLADPPAQFFAQRALPEPQRDHLTYCFGHGCRIQARTGLSEKHWQQIAGQLVPPAATPAQERNQLAQAVGEFEKILGTALGTLADKPGSFAGTFDDKQLDCIDETVNTTTVLILLEKAGLMRHHRTGYPQGRGALVQGDWPHYSAIVLEQPGGAAYALDSWFRAAGARADVVPLAEWRDGWVPKSFN